MENEKKKSPEANSAKGNHKNNFYKRKPHKPKAYYMTPDSAPAPETEVKPAADAQKPQQNKQKSADSTQKQGSGRQNQGRPNHHNNRKGKLRDNRDNRDNRDSSAQQASKEVKEIKEPKDIKEIKESSAQSNQNAGKSGKNNNRRRKNRPHQQSKPTDAPVTADVAKKDAQKPNDLLDLSMMPSQRTAKSDRLEPPVKKLEKFTSSPEYAKYSDYEEFTFDELYGDKENSKPVTQPENDLETVSEASEQSEAEPTVEVVGIRFKPSGKTYYFEPCGVKLRVGTHAIVKTARGLEYGEVALANTFVKESETVPPLRPVVREATQDDVKHNAENKAKEDEAFHICNEKIIEHELEMKLIDAQFTFDNTKLLFYFTSAGRVDFRELVKDLASVFRTRIELRQIGIRDEAKMVGGLGLCGRPLCCSLFLSDFGQVSIKMAKDQNLSLNSSKISGICGRLMCCLRYEYEAYEYEIKRTPPVDSLVRTVDGVGTVTEISPLAGTIKVKLHDADAPPKTYKRDEVTVLKKKNS